jgi:PhnB protein
MHVSTYLNFNGECAKAIEFYEKAIGAKLLFKMTWGESPMAKDCPARNSWIDHALDAAGR